MTTKISKLTETYSGNTSGSLLTIEIDPITLAMPGDSLGADSVFYVKVIATNTSSDGGGPNGTTTRNAALQLSGGSLTLQLQQPQVNFSGNVNIGISATVSDDIEIDLTYLNSFTQTDGCVFIEIYGYTP